MLSQTLLELSLFKLELRVYAWVTWESTFGLVLCVWCARLGSAKNKNNLKNLSTQEKGVDPLTGAGGLS